MVDTPIIYGWQSYEEAKERAGFELGHQTRTMTATVITLIDTVQNITSTVTEGYVRSDTNEAGTRTQIVTYTQQGVAKSTAV